MPSSHYSQLNEIVELIVRAHPSSMIEIGPGFGKYGFLSREYLELWDGRELYNDWQCRIDAIEAFPSYITPLQKSLYNNIYVGDARDLVHTLPGHYDLALMVDVFEHFTYDDGLRLLRQCLMLANAVIISTPKSVNVQGAAFGNPYETHRFEWKAQHFREFTPRFYLRHHSNLILFIGKDAKQIRRDYRRSKIKMFFKKNFRFLRIFRPLLKQ